MRVRTRKEKSASGRTKFPGRPAADLDACWLRWFAGSRSGRSRLSRPCAPGEVGVAHRGDVGDQHRPQESPPTFGAIAVSASGTPAASSAARTRAPAR